MKELALITDTESKILTTSRPNKQITLRQLLTHSSGIGYDGDPVIEKWRETATPAEIELYNSTLGKFLAPLLYEPGEGWLYGASIDWTQQLVSRLTGQPLPEYVQANIFDPLGVTSTTYRPDQRQDISLRRLQMVERKEHGLVAVPNFKSAPISSALDVTRIMSDLVSPNPKVLKHETADLIFTPQLAPSSAALQDLQRKTEDYATPAGIPPMNDSTQAGDATLLKAAPVNWSFGGLLAEEKFPLSHMPAGTVTWNGMPNVIWAMHRPKGVCMLFATQLLPVDDGKAVDLAMSFFREAWDQF